MTPEPLELVVDEDLRVFLPPRRRAGPVLMAVDGTSSLGHLVQSAGVPLTEVGSLVVGGIRVEAGFRPAGGERVRVTSRPRPQPLAVGPRFLLDVHLGSLARRLRLLGLDTSYPTEADDDELAAQALAEGRMLLTQDRGLLRRTALRDTAAFVRGTGADDQLLDVLDRFAPPLTPYSRCLACNSLLHPVAKDDVRNLLEPGTARWYDEFSQCSGCGRVYWQGAHAARLADVLAHALVDDRSRPRARAASIVRHNREEAR